MYATGYLVCMDDVPICCGCCSRATVQWQPHGLLAAPPSPPQKVGGESYLYDVAPPEIAEARKGWQALADKYQLPLPAVALRFASLPAVMDCVLLGVKSAAEVELNAKTIAHAAVRPHQVARIAAKSPPTTAERVATPPADGPDRDLARCAEGWPALGRPSPASAPGAMKHPTQSTPRYQHKYVTVTPHLSPSPSIRMVSSTLTSAHTNRAKGGYSGPQNVTMYNFLANRSDIFRQTLSATPAWLLRRWPKAESLASVSVGGVPTILWCLVFCLALSASLALDGYGASTLLRGMPFSN